ncbi:hypothetical protein CN138_29725 [Sinorhizobium meliloti]|nr:hypothetical protein [Sinorhizobium meliloti]MDW9477140.1 hypothetical protein [Sinorhizobium meliloti]MDX0061030.1 hypothetical protein [Sinorhizobium meliloti]MDX0234950.1 hypothetical protein [Sinorhizobium meliloti]MQX60824.1 hypothetical protein [Sinorhizobium meliloti]MQX72591.1 hypothetical protein [Sinorhizobium meliloti]
MVAPNYARKRSELARASGLGRNRRQTTEATIPASGKIGLKFG